MTFIQKAVRKFCRWLRDEDRKDARRAAARAARNIPPPEKWRLTFEQTPDPTVLEVYSDRLGLSYFAHNLQGVPNRKDPTVMDHSHWLAHGLHGQITDDRQGPQNTAFVIVTARYFPVDKELGDAEEALLTFEVNSSELLIFFNPKGLQRILDRLNLLSGNDLSHPFSDIWTTTSPAGGMLGGEQQATKNVLVKQVTLHYRP